MSAAENGESVGLDMSVCDECGHAIGAHGDVSGCSLCRCPFYRSDLLPMTPEQVAAARAARGKR
jgi:hypothetical protein